MLKADAMVLGSPTYFAAVSADLKALIERTGYVAFANNHAFSGKIGAAVVAVRLRRSHTCIRYNQPHVSNVQDDNSLF
jgi:multimeric flavodoxin WrbA